MCVCLCSAVTIRQSSVMTVILEIAASLKGSASPVIRGSSLLPADAGCTGRTPRSDWTCHWNAK